LLSVLSELKMKIKNAPIMGKKVIRDKIGKFI